MLNRFFISKRNLVFLLYSFLSFSLLANCETGNTPNENKNSTLLKHPDWSYNLSIYEVNTRQYSSEGTFNAFAPTMPKLKDMGIGILWFMPINPIGIVNRKGSLGSYYAVRDYTAVNPEFGTVEDFKSVVKQAHSLGMKVIIDWVANHTSWDNVWTKTHPEFYKKDAKGNFVSQYDWTDVIKLNYDNKELWNYMRDAMKFWIEQCDIDGFRCDVAALVPLEFWTWVRPQLDAVKPVFMLAEASEPQLHAAFDMTYNWQLKDLFVECAKGNKNAEDFYKYFESEKKDYSSDGYRMVFTSNHDENSWNGTDQERFGNAAEAFAVTTTLVPGVPLVYNGQEAGLNKRLLFFEKDQIDWKENKMRDLYTKLFQLKKENKSLWNGALGGGFQRVSVTDNNIFAFTREKNGNKIFAIFNYSNEKKTITIKDTQIEGSYKNFLNGNSIILSQPYQTSLEPWAYQIFYKQ